MPGRPLSELLPYGSTLSGNLPELELGVGIAKLRIKFTLFVDIYGKLSGEIRREDVRQALVDMGAEVRQTYQAIVEVLTPLYAIRDEDHLVEAFPEIRAKYKSIYLDSSQVVHIHCDLVQEKLEIMLRAKGWQSKVPIARQSYSELKEICRRWLLDDESMIYEMNEFFIKLNRFLDRIERARRSKPEKAYSLVQTFLSQIEPDFLAIQRGVADLAAAGRAVG